MSAPRPEKVEEMVNAMLEAMTELEDDTTATELFSAAMTLALRTIKVVLERGASPDKVQEAVQRLLIECENRGNPTVH